MSDRTLLRSALFYGVDDRTAVWSALFLLFVFAYERFALGIDPVKGSSWFQDGTVSTLVASIYVGFAIWLFYGFVVISLAAKPSYKIFGNLIFTVIILVEYSYVAAVGRLTNFLDVYNAILVTPEQSEYSLLEFTSSSWIMPVALLASLAFGLRNSTQIVRSRTVGIWAFLVLVFYVQLSMIGLRIFGDRLYATAFDAFVQTSVDYALSWPGQATQRPPRKTLETVSGDSKPRGNIVLVFDESVRPDHLSLNGYERDTTPFLSALAKRRLIVNWGTVSSASTASVPSYNYFIAGATPSMIQDSPLELINRMPSIFQYAKAMNYTTHFFDAQMKYYWGGVPDDLRYIDHYVNIGDLDPNRVEDWQSKDGLNTNPKDEANQLKQWDIDAKIAATTKEIVGTSSGNFIMIYKRGVHFPYEKNYPENEARWKPTYTFRSQWETPPVEFKEQVINSYDNSIASNLDRFFIALIDDYDVLPNDTVIVYTSDHGQRFGVPGAAGHGGDSKEEASVPLFMIGLADRNVDTRFRASHANLFSGLLDLMNVPQDLRAYPYEKSLLGASGNDSTVRFYNLLDGRKIAFD